MYNMGIYSITNKINGKRYIGSAVNIKKRWTVHKSDLKKNRHHSFHLQQAWNKYKEDNFVFEKICKVWDKERLTKIEQIFFDLYKTHDEQFGYNICKTAGNCLGHRHSLETKSKMSLSKEGTKNSFFGKCHTKETRKNFSKRMIGKNNPNYGKFAEKHHNFGKIFSEETKKKMSKATFGENNPRAKLTWEKVKEIREKYSTGDYSYRQLAQEYGITYSHVGLIIRNKSWIVGDNE